MVLCTERFGFDVHVHRKEQQEQQEQQSRTAERHSTAQKHSREAEQLSSRAATHSFYYLCRSTSVWRRFHLNNFSVVCKLSDRFCARPPQPKNKNASAGSHNFLFSRLVSRPSGPHSGTLANWGADRGVENTTQAFLLTGDALRPTGHRQQDTVDVIVPGFWYAKDPRRLAQDVVRSTVGRHSPLAPVPCQGGFREWDR